jgi:hypothetical protein
MGATSNEGTGLGAAGPNRGPGNNRNQYVSLLDEHVVYSGYATPTEGSGGEGSAAFYTINVPSRLKDVPEKLTLMVAGKAFTITKNLDANGLVESFGVIGTKKVGFDFVIIKSPSSNFIPDFGFAP